MLYFITATYNEEEEISDLLKDMAPYVDGIRVCDDGSTDRTVKILQSWRDRRPYFFDYKVIEHTGLPETVKAAALEMVPDGAWVALLDCDERFSHETLTALMDFVLNDSLMEEFSDVTHVYLRKEEYIDGKRVRTFQKPHLFKKESVTFSTTIHEDERFTGRGIYLDLPVLHRKTSYKQIKRETEYLATYKKLLVEGKIDEGRYNWLTSLHHFVRPHG